MPPAKPYIYLLGLLLQSLKFDEQSTPRFALWSPRFEEWRKTATSLDAQRSPPMGREDEQRPPQGKESDFPLVKRIVNPMNLR